MDWRRMVPFRAFYLSLASIPIILAKFMHYKLAMYRAGYPCLDQCWTNMESSESRMQSWFLHYKSRILSSRIFPQLLGFRIITKTRHRGPPTVI